MRPTFDTICKAQVSDDPWKKLAASRGGDESTQEIDVEALRAEARREAPSSDRETARGNVHEDLTVMAPARRPAKRGGVIRDDGEPPAPWEGEIGTRPTPFEPWRLNEEELADLADVESVHDLEDSDVNAGRRLGELPAPSRIQDPAPSLIGTLPGHDVAQALRAMMGEVPDYEPTGGALGQATEEDLREARGQAFASEKESTLMSEGEDSSPAASSELTPRFPEEFAGGFAARLPEEFADVTPNFALPSKIDEMTLARHVGPLSSRRDATILDRKEVEEEEESLEDGETQTRLPESTSGHAAIHTIQDDDALPAFSLEDDERHVGWSDEAAGRPHDEHVALTRRTPSGFPSPMESGPPSGATIAAHPEALDPFDLADRTDESPALSTRASSRTPSAIGERHSESTAVTRAHAPLSTRPTAETTAVFAGPVPSLARGPHGVESQALTKGPFELHMAEASDDASEANDERGGQWVAASRDSGGGFAAVDSAELDVAPLSAHEDALPRFTLASVADAGPDPMGGVSATEPPASLGDETVARSLRSWMPPDGWASSPPESLRGEGTLIAKAPEELLHLDEPPPIEPDEIIDDHTADSEDGSISKPQLSISAATGLGVTEESTAVGLSLAQTDDEMTAAGQALSDESPGVAEVAGPASGLTGGTDLAGADEAPLDEADIEEITEDEVIDDDPTGASLSRQKKEEEPRLDLGSVRPLTPSRSRPPPGAEVGDAEELELIAAQRWTPLIAHYRQRMADTDSPTKKALLLVKIAGVYESGLQDLNEAFLVLVDAFETQPTNEEVITQIDRVGIATGRIGELADKVRKKLVPKAPDDKRVTYLGHLVYWYEKVLSRGKEVSPLVSDIERHDKVHPVVLKRAAQIAAMNSDTKTQREHLLRALERTYRREEKVALHLALASAFAGTPDAVKHYQLAIEIDPACLVAIQGLKRIGREKEQHAQVQWALERQVEVAPTDSEKVDALLELAELQETKFLKREEAAELLERVLLLEPSQPQALKGLERCYHALRDWPKLARILSIRSEHTFEKKTKLELLELAAEVHESKLGDPAGAADVYQSILEIEPKHRRALTDLARLSEKNNDWPNLAVYKARLAELAASKRAASQDLVKLGDFLNVPERAPSIAKDQYERALELDSTNAAAWEALQRVAAAEGDELKVIDCLENRKKHTDVPRQRAVVLVELAHVYLGRGEEDEAQRCFEAAIQADSSNEIAAIAMLDTYTAEERWAEAAPLCELLVNAAIRDRDGESLFVRLRLATRIAAALGDADRAVTSALAALDARPKDAGAQSDLIAVCAQSAPALERARTQVTQIAEDPSEELSLEMVVRLGGLLRDIDLDLAAATLERARRESPEDREIARELSDVFLAQADYPHACKVKVDLARSAETPEEQFTLLVEVGEIWAKRAEELEKAATIFEEARAIKPMDPWLLSTLMWLYGELGEWEILARVLEDIVQIQDNPEEKVKTLLSLSEVVRDHLDDRVRSADLYDAILDIDKKRLDVFEEVVRTLTEAKNWERLERAYRKMIARVKDDDEPELQFLLFHQLGLIYRDRLGDASRAYDALDAASRLKPDDGEIRKIVIELLVVTDNLDNAVTRIRAEIDRDPHNSQLYAELYELFLRQHSFDKAWCVVNVLCRMSEPSSEQRRFHEDYAPMPLDRVPGQIVEQAWRSHIFHADLETELTNLFTLMTPAVARLRFGQLRPEQRVGRPFTPTHSRLHDAIRMTFNNASEILAVSSPELLLGDPKALNAFSPALAPFGSISICVPQVEAQSASLIYLIGKRLAEQRPELAARAFFPSVPDLTSLLGTALRVSRNEVAKDAANAALDASFAAILTPQERDGIRTIVLSATADGAALDVKKWTTHADLSSMRAGLLLCGDVEPARLCILSDGAPASDLSADEKIGELYKFAVSDLYSDLRGAIGVAVSDT